MFSLVTSGAAVGASRAGGSTAGVCTHEMQAATDRQNISPEGLYAIGIPAPSAPGEARMRPPSWQSTRRRSAAIFEVADVAVADLLSGGAELEKLLGLLDASNCDFERIGWPRGLGSVKARKDTVP